MDHLYKMKQLNVTAKYFFNIPEKHTHTHLLFIGVGVAV